MDIEERPTIVFDAGGRYGLHPTWRAFKAPLDYHLFEPDREEADRLTRKYASRAGAVSTHAIALGESAGTLRINVLRHKGQSSALTPKTDSLWFRDARPDEGEVVSAYDAPMSTIDAQAARLGRTPDFLKLDTEGSELSILRGAARCLSESVLAVRSETHFDPVYEGMALFPELHAYMLAHGFSLLNLEYAGAGVPWSEFADGPRYGSLVGCDAVWIKRPTLAFDRSLAASVQAERALKLAAFCLANDAADAGLRILLDARAEHGALSALFAGRRLFAHVDVAVQRLFYRLRFRPGRDPERLDAVYRDLFGRDPKLMHEFFESDEINPD